VLSLSSALSMPCLHHFPQSPQTSARSLPVYRCVKWSVTFRGFLNNLTTSPPPLYCPLTPILSHVPHERKINVNYQGLTRILQSHDRPRMTRGHNGADPPFMWETSTPCSMPVYPGAFTTSRFHVVFSFGDSNAKTSRHALPPDGEKNTPYLVIFFLAILLFLLYIRLIPNPKRVLISPDGAVKKAAVSS
jgi:hypothetical protein